MHESPAPHVERYIPFKQEGWGVALFIVLLAIATASWATYVHKTTYKAPTDVRFRAAGSAGTHD
jgi:hypothetical protein